MTGFSRAEGQGEGYGWAWEAKSVNARGFDLRLRLPPGYEGVEPRARASVRDRFKRGNVTLQLAVTPPPGIGQLRINEAALDQVIALVGDLAKRVDAAPPRLDGLLAVRGVVETVETETPEMREAREAAILETLDTAIAALAAARAREGEQIGLALGGHVARLETLAAAARDHAATQPEALGARLRRQIGDILDATAALSEERLIQEVAVLATKADIREELDRLDAHLATAKELLADKDPVGRRLDFLCQELNREANTLCSKSIDVGLTRIGMDIKVEIERLREQVQNIE